MTKKINGEIIVLDYIKIIAAILVVAIHTRPFSTVEWLYQGIQVVARCAVPFFFTTSGYFLYENLKKSEEKSLYKRKYLFRIWKSYTVWSVIYVVYLFFVGKQWENMPKLLFFFFSYGKRYLLNGTLGHLWYMVALIWTSVIAYWVFVKKKTTLIWIISVVMIYIAVIIYPYRNLLEIAGIYVSKEVIDSEFVRQFLFMPISYVMLGGIISVNRERIKQGNLFLCIVFGGLYVLEHMILKNVFGTYDLLFSIIQYPLIASIFIFAINTKIKGNGLKARNMAAYIYFFHALGIYIVNRIAMYLNIEISATSLFVCTLIFAVGTGAIVVNNKKLAKLLT